MIDRFMNFVSPEPNSGCWLWSGNCSPDGYGMFQIGSVNKQTAHKFSYQSFVGKIPDGLQLDHKCRVRCCVNPEHLEPVTMRENILRGMSLPAINARKSSCKHGHALTEENVRRRKDGSRNCKACDKARWERIGK